MHPLMQLRNLCKPTPLRGRQLQALAVGRDDLDEAYRLDLRIAAALSESSDEHPKVLLFGSRGCGKSTELARLEERLSDRYLMVGLDLGMNPIQRDKLTTEELLLLIGLAVAKASREVWGLDMSAPLLALQRAIKPLWPNEASAKLDLGEMLKSLVLFGATALGPSGAAAAGVATVVKNLTELTASAVRAEVDIGGLLARPRTQGPSFAVLDAVNEILRVSEAGGGRPALILVDELDKIDDAEHSFTLLTEHGLVPALSAPMVITGPNRILQEARLRRLGELYTDVAFLYHVRCWDREDPGKPDPTGMAKLREIVHRRIGQTEVPVPELLAPEAEQLLVLQCGGVVRDLVRMLGLSAQYAHLARASRIELPHATRAVAVLRREFEHFLSSQTLERLRETARQRRVPELDALTLQLLDDNFIVTYSNGELWHYPHAVLLGLLDGQGSTR